MKKAAKVMSSKISTSLSDDELEELDKFPLSESGVKERVRIWADNKSGTSLPNQMTV